VRLGVVEKDGCHRFGRYFDIYINGEQVFYRFGTPPQRYTVDSMSLVDFADIPPNSDGTIVVKLVKHVEPSGLVQTREPMFSLLEFSNDNFAATTLSPTPAPATGPTWIGIIGRRLDYTDNDGNVWYHASQKYSADFWGGYEGRAPAIGYWEDAYQVQGNLSGYDMAMYQSSVYYDILATAEQLVTANHSIQMKVNVGTDNGPWKMRLGTIEVEGDHRMGRQVDIYINGQEVKNNFEIGSEAQYALDSESMLDFTDIEPNSDGTIVVKIAKHTDWTREPMFAWLEFSKGNFVH